MLPFGPDGHSNGSAPGTILWTKTGNPTVVRVATVDGASVLLTLDTEAPVLVGQRHLGNLPMLRDSGGRKGGAAHKVKIFKHPITTFSPYYIDEMLKGYV